MTAASIRPAAADDVLAIGGALADAFVGETDAPGGGPHIWGRLRP